uniref:Ribosomal protein S3 n=1 Tax=Gastroclonium compressum TaxID=1852973 RepID=A0A173FZP4_GASCM|nr:ribosomal protein S3 [Coeloseira compressa]
MPRKINPTSFRLGILQVWSTFFQNYGNSLNNYVQFLTLKFNIQQFFFNFYQYSKFLIFNSNLQLNKSFIFFNFYSPHFIINKNLVCKILPSFLDTHFLFRFYVIPYFFFLNLNLLISYIQFLFNKSINLLKIIRDITLIFFNNIGLKRIILSKNGPLVITLIGFKIYLSGRFDNSRNQMAKCVFKHIGVTPTSSLKHYVEFKYFKINSKLGIIGLQIWIFYTIE